MEVAPARHSFVTIYMTARYKVRMWRRRSDVAEGLTAEFGRHLFRAQVVGCVSTGNQGLYGVGTR